MSRVTNAILQPGTAYAAGHQAPMVDLTFGGQMGYAPELTEWVSNAPYVRKNLIPLLVEAPRGFRLLPNPNYWISTLRSLVELHSMSIEGLNAGLRVEIGDVPVGGGGQVQQYFTDVKEEQSNPTFRFNEKYGMPVKNFFRGWIQYLMMDANSKYAGVSTLGDGAPPDMLPDLYTATMMFIEPDPTHTKVVQSWLVTNMFPQSAGDVQGRRDLTQAADTNTYDIQFTGIAQYGLGVDAFAQQLLDGILLTGANPNMRPAFVQKIAEDVLAQRKGYENGVETLGATAIRV